MPQGLRSSDIVSLSRIPLALLFVALYRAEPGFGLFACIAIALLAQLSDHIDGLLARRSGGPSVRGWLFDSVSDRAFYIGALLAFARELGLNEVLIWAFTLREIALYAFRVLTGEFEAVWPRFRAFALCHAGMVRLAIAFGCIIPLNIIPTGLQTIAPVLLTSLFMIATGLGYVSLVILIRSRRQGAGSA